MLRALIIPVLACAALLCGCEGRESLTVWETKVRFADSILRGSEVGLSWTITADSFDDAEGVLVGVRLDDNDGRYYFAERGHILVDPATDSVRLRLEDVTAAIAEEDGSDNLAAGVHSSEEIVTEPVKMPFDVTP